MKTPAVLRSSHHQFSSASVKKPLGTAQGGVLLRQAERPPMLKPTAKPVQVHVPKVALPSKCHGTPDGALLRIVNESWQDAMHTERRDILRQYVRFALRRRDAYAYQDYFLLALQHAVAALDGLREERARRYTLKLALKDRPAEGTLKYLQNLLGPYSDDELRAMMNRVMEDVYKRLCSAIRAGRTFKNVSNPHGYSYVQITIPERSRTMCICTVDFTGKHLEILALQTPSRFNRQVKNRLRSPDRRLRPRHLRRVS